MSLVLFFLLFPFVNDGCLISFGDKIVRLPRIKQTFDLRKWGRVGETGGPAHSIGGPAHSDGIAMCRSSNA